MATQFSNDAILKVAKLARLQLDDADLAHYPPQLTNILSFIEKMNEVNTDNIEPLAHPLQVTQRLREDKVTEVNQRDAFQAIAPETEVGLYLVPQVIE